MPAVSFRADECFKASTVSEVTTPLPFLTPWSRSVRTASTTLRAFRALPDVPPRQPFSARNALYGALFAQLQPTSLLRGSQVSHHTSFLTTSAASRTATSVAGQATTSTRRRPARPPWTR